MILVSHSIIGTSLGILQSSPYASFFVALISHYLTDMIPHYEYSIAGLKENADARETRKTFLRIMTDGILAVIVPVLIFYFGGYVNGWYDLIILLAAILGSVIPDAVQGVTLVFSRNRVLRAHQMMHDAIHHAISSDNMGIKRYPVLGISSQVILCLVFLAFGLYFG